MMIHFNYHRHHRHHRHHHHHQLLSLLLWLLVVLAIAVGCTLGFTATTTTTTTKTSSACSSSSSSSSASAAASAAASVSSSFGDFSSSTFVTSTTQSSSSSSSSSALQMVSSSGNEFSGKDLLYQDQQLAMERRANEEEILLRGINNSTPPKELTSPKNLKPKPPKSGKGFGSNVKTSSSGANDDDDDDDDDDSIENRIAIEQCKIIQRDGVIKISNVLSEKMADELREYVLEQQQIASQIVEKSNNSLSVSKSFYGVENSRKSRCDLQLSLLKGGYLSDGNNNNGNESSESTTKHVHQKHTIADTLNALLGSGSNNSGSSSSKTTNNGGGKNGVSKNNNNGNNRGIGTLRKVYENLVTKDGEFYELAAVITNPGSKRQQIHPDLPYQNDNGAPLYVVFLALQDITEEMGPTTFLLKTHNSQSHQTQFLSNDIEIKNNQLLKIASLYNVKISTLQKGDCVIFDARILHCGNANLDETNGGRTRALFNFSFRNPKVTGNLGYPGSIRPGYIKQMNLNDMFNCLDNYNTNNNKIGDDNDNDDPFKEYGDGLLH